MKQYCDDFLLDLYSLIESYKDKDLMIHGLRDLETGLDALESGFYFRSFFNKDDLYEDVDDNFSVRDQNILHLHCTCKDLFYIPFLSKLKEVSKYDDDSLSFFQCALLEDDFHNKKTCAKSLKDGLDSVINYNYSDGRGNDYLLLISAPLDEKILKSVPYEERKRGTYLKKCDAYLDRKYIVALVDKVGGKIIRRNDYIDKFFSHI